MQKHPTKVASLVAAFLVICGPAFSQVANAPVPSVNSPLKQEEVIELSPFIVSEGEESGWVANNTLVGSRLRSKLDDVATQMEVFTMDFMSEFGFNSVDKAAVYSLNIENSGEYVRDVESKSGDDPALRVRGLGSARRTREFFATNALSDNYNLERVTLASGPNPMMFGVGAPTGAIDSTLARPIMNRSTSSVKMQADSFGGMRGEFHFNQTLVRDKLAILGALLADNQKSDIKPSLAKDRRLYGAMLYTPFKKTRFSAHFERAQNLSRIPPRVSPLDQLSVWYRAGDLGSTLGNKPIFSNDLAWQATRVSPDTRIFNTSGDGAVSVIAGANPANLAPRGSFYSVSMQNINDSGRFPGIIDNINAGTTRGVALLNDNWYPRDTSYTYYTDVSRKKASTVNLFFNQEILKNLNLEVGYQREALNNFDGSHLFGGNGGLNVNVDPNKYLPDGVTLNPYAGMLFFDGLVGYSSGTDVSEEKRGALSYEFDFKDHSKNKWVGLLGRHRFAGIMSSIREKTMSQEYRYNFIPKVENGRMRDPVFSGVNYVVDSTGRRGLAPLGAGFSATANNRIVNIRSYVSQDFGWEPRADQYEIGTPWQIKDNTGEVWTIDPENAAIGTNGERLIMGRNTGGSNIKFDTKLFSYQGFLLDDRVVLTYGSRKDSNNTALAVAPVVKWKNPETGVDVTATSAGFQPHQSLYTYAPFNPAAEASGPTTLKGIVVHPFRNWNWKLPLGADISLNYTKSNTFAPNTTRRDPDGAIIASERGEGFDQGVRVSFFEGAFNMRFNEYQVDSGPTVLGALFAKIRENSRQPMLAITRALTKDKNDFLAKFPIWPMQNNGQPGPLTTSSLAFPFAKVDNGGFETMNFFNYLEPYSATANQAAKGKEISLQWKPTKNWDLRLTWNKQEIVQTNIAEKWLTFVDQFEAIMNKTTFTEGYIPGDTEVVFQNPAGFDMDGDGVIRQYTWDAMPSGGFSNAIPQSIGQLSKPWGRNDDLFPGGWVDQTMKEQWTANVRTGSSSIGVLQAYNGRPNEFTRSNRANFNAMYRFSEGKLKGLRVGGAYRWRAAPAIGFGVKTVSGVQMPDVNLIQYGPQEHHVDLSLGYSSKSKWLGNRKYSVDLNVRDVLPGDKYITRNRDFFTGNALSAQRMPPTQYVFSMGIDL